MANDNQAGFQTEREELMAAILAKLNPDRMAKGYKPYTTSKVSELLAHLREAHKVRDFLKKCESSKLPFGAYFHWAIKPENRGK